MIYQEIKGERKVIEGKFVITEGDQVSFQVASYDRKKRLIIDPVLEYSTYLGGNGGEYKSDIAVDASGNAYVTGVTTSTNFPIRNPFQASHGGDMMLLSLKLSPVALLQLPTTVV